MFQQQNSIDNIIIGKLRKMKINNQRVNEVRKKKQKTWKK